MTGGKHKQLFPSVLIEQLVAALKEMHLYREILRIDGDATFGLLKRFRDDPFAVDKRSRYDLSFLDLEAGRDPRTIGGVPVSVLENLDKALKALHAYKSPEGPSKYMAMAVYREAQRANSSQHRESISEAESIKAEARKLGYFDLPPYSRDKPKILDQIIERLRLYTDADTSRANQHRHLRRVLDEAKVDI